MNLLVIDIIINQANTFTQFIFVFMLNDACFVIVSSYRLKVCNNVAQSPFFRQQPFRKVGTLIFNFRNFHLIMKCLPFQQMNTYMQTVHFCLCFILQLLTSVEQSLSKNIPADMHTLTVNTYMTLSHQHAMSTSFQKAI